MMPQIGYSAARDTLEKHFAEVEDASFEGAPPTVEAGIVDAYDVMFKSRTQAFREALLGCILARLHDKGINIRLPYTGHGQDAYNGRTLDEKVVNPFLRSKKIPCSKGPFLNVFRRSVQFTEDARRGKRDTKAYDAFLSVITVLEKTGDQDLLTDILRYHFHRFIQLREATVIEMAKLRRISLQQCEELISGLLNTQSGGRFPMFVIVSAFETLKKTLGLDWDIEYQGINVADGASGAGGDVTIKDAGKVVLAAEVTERLVDRSRVVSTFDTKIAPNAIEDYLFFIKNRVQAAAAVEQAKRYFSQGHEINFLEITNWIVTMLSVLGRKGRQLFINEMVCLLDDIAVPAALKVAWNEIIVRIASGTPE